MSEFIIIQVGQCGNQIGSCFLPEILREYDIKLSGNDNSKAKDDLQKYISSFFNIKDGKSSSFESLDDLVKSNVKARFICIDMEDSVVGRIRYGKYKDLYEKRSLITNYPGSGNNWAEGHWSHGSTYEHKILKAVQYNVEQCDNLHGFLLLFSVGGGTGSGLGTFVVKLLAEHYPNIERFVACVYPTGTEDVITCPYNMAFATQELSNHATCVFPVENMALLDIVFKQTNRYNTKANHISPFRPFEDMNSIIVNMMLHLTSGSRFCGAMNIDMNEINTNMIPFPKLNYLSSGFSPVWAKDTISIGKQHKNETFLSACSRNNQLLKIDPFDPKHVSMSCSLLGRGIYAVNDMRSYVAKLQPKLHFAPWSKKAIKIGLCDVPPKGTVCSMFTLFNTTAISTLFQTILSQFMKLYQRKAHVHHYTNIEGFEQENFRECQETLIDIIELYTQKARGSIE